MRTGEELTVERPSLLAGHLRPDRVTLRRRAHHGMCLAATVLTTVGVCLAPSAVADSSASLRNAVVAARGTSCGPLRYNPAVEQAAQKINTTTDKWIDFNTRALPESDALPLLKDLGYAGSKATILSGASKTDANAIKAVLLQGYIKIPDCQYTDFGVSAQHNAGKDLTLTTIVLAA